MYTSVEKLLYPTLPLIKMDKLPLIFGYTTLRRLQKKTVNFYFWITFHWPISLFSVVEIIILVAEITFLLTKIIFSMAATITWSVTDITF